MTPPPVLLRFWRRHSLSLTAIGMGAALSAIAWPLKEGRGFDYLSGFGASFVTAGAFGLLQGPLRERNKPED